MDRHLHRPRLRAAIAGRLTFDAPVISTGTGTGSCQLRTAQARRQSARTLQPPQEALPMALISQPGSDYQIVSVSLDAGYTRDLILMLIDVHAVLDHLYLDGTQPEITSPAEDYLRESASPYSLPALIDALGEATGQLSRAERQALDGIPPGPPASGPAGSNPAASF